MGKKHTKLLLAVFAIVLGYLFFTWVNSPNPAYEENRAVGEEDNVRGNVDAAVTIIEYADFQCSACSYYAALTKELERQKEGEVRIVFRHFPLASIHKNAFSAALASEAAGRQDKFWEMHDFLFQTQPEWENADNAKEVFEGYAEIIGLDIAQYGKDYESSQLNGKVQKDLDLALELGLNATPTFFVNGRRIRNPSSLEDFKAIVDKKLAF